MQEKNLSSEGASPPSHSDKVVALLEEKIKEREETISSQNQKINALEKDSVNRQSEIDFLKKSIDDKTVEVKGLQDTIGAKEKELTEIKEKHETELSEKEVNLQSQVKINDDLQRTVATLKESLAGLESKENVTERLLLLDAEKEQQFRDEKQAFHDQLQSYLDQNNKIAEELGAAKAEIEVKEKEVRDLNAKLGKLKLQAKAKMTSLQNEKEKLSKDMQEVHTFVNSKQNLSLYCISLWQDLSTFMAKGLLCNYLNDFAIYSLSKPFENSYERCLLSWG